jgi:hypothetical protein
MEAYMKPYELTQEQIDAIWIVTSGNDDTRRFAIMRAAQKKLLEYLLTKQRVTKDKGIVIYITRDELNFISKDLGIVR